MKFEYTEVWGFEHAIRGMRNPKNSWDRSDSFWTKQTPETIYVIGENDMKLMQTLIKSGSEHRKFMRQILVSVDITAPLYWWKEFSTYKVGTVENSTSTMHKLASTPITMDCFECGEMLFEGTIENLENLRITYNELKSIFGEKCRRNGKDFETKELWKQLIVNLPESWLQTRTVTMNYENLLAMCSKGQRRNHKLNEWSGKDKPDVENFIKWARSLPYAQELIFIDEVAE